MHRLIIATCRRPMWVAVTAVVLYNAPIAAQPRTPVREGFTAALGLARTVAALSCDTCASGGVQSGSGGRMMLGFTVRRDLILGIELEGGASDGDRGWRGMSWSSVFAQWYPRVEQGWFVKAGIGRTSGRLAGPSPNWPYHGPYQSTSGGGLIGGVGYDWRVARSISLTPYATWAWASRAPLRNAVGESSVRFGGHILMYGVALTLH